ncbi:MAG: amino acid ABC transporter substrate-binding protein [Deltaproteobacteria bacterium]|nr:amino acid ABC transporter substrate-binding protein [Deltaproteobacteria bacterium]
MNSFYTLKFLRRVLFCSLLMGALSMCMVACGSENLIEQRSRHLEKLSKGKPVKLAVVWSRLYGDSYYRGVEMAVNELNASGGVVGHPIEPLLIDQYTNLEEARRAVYPLGEDMDVVFTLGFYKSEMANSLMQLMQYYGLPVLTNANADDVLENQWTGGIFRGTVTSSYFGKILYEECIKQKAESVILCYSSEMFTASIAADMITRLRDNTGVNARIYRIDALTNDWQFKLKDDVNAATFHGQKTAAVILMNDLKVIKTLLSLLVKEGRIDMGFATQMGFDVDFKAGKELSRKLKIPLFIVADMVEATLKTIEEEAGPDSIVGRFRKKYGRLPNEIMLYGYEQTMAVGNAMKKANSVVPAKVIKALRTLDYKGLMQSYVFTKSGELKNSNCFMVAIRDGEVSASLR